MGEEYFNHPEKTKRLPRASVLLAATITTFGLDSSSTHRVRDLSRGGVRIDNPEPLQIGATVLVSVGELNAVSAQVMWIRDGFAGLAFGEEIDLEQARARAVVVPKKTRGISLNKIVQ